MSTEEIMNLIDEHLQEVNSNEEERIKRTEELLGFLNYNLRLSKLSEEEKQDFVYCNEGFPWTEKMRSTYNNARDEQTKEYYINMWARSTYFRLCAWQNYLFGYTTDKPFIQKKEKQAA